MIALCLTILAAGIYCYRPDHKYRLTIAVDTPQGIKSASGVIAIYKDKFSIGGVGGGVAAQGDAIFVDLGGGRNLVALLSLGKNGSDVDGVDYLAMNAFAAAGQKVSFKEVKELKGEVDLQSNLIPTLVTFADLSDPWSARVLESEHIDAVLGRGYRLDRVTLRMVPVGLWPIDFGRGLGEPVTRGIEAKLPFLISERESLRRIIDDMPPRFQPHYYLFER